MCIDYVPFHWAWAREEAARQPSIRLAPPEEKAEGSPQGRSSGSLPAPGLAPVDISEDPPVAAKEETDMFGVLEEPLDDGEGAMLEAYDAPLASVEEPLVAVPKMLEVTRMKSTRSRGHSSTSMSS